MAIDLMRIDLMKGSLSTKPTHNVNSVVCAHRPPHPLGVGRVGKINNLKCCICLATDFHTGPDLVLEQVLYG